MTALVPNSGLSLLASNGLQLSYVPVTNPTPLRASSGSGGETELGSLQFVITNPTSDPIDVSEIVFVVTVGIGEALMQSTENVAATVSDTATWQFNGPPSVITGGTASFTLTPASGKSVSVAGGATFAAEISNFETVTAAASTLIHVKETLAGGTENRGDFVVTTFPEGFFFTGLTASVPSANGLTPVAAVSAGTQVILTWSSSVVDTTAMTIDYTGGPSGGVPPASSGSWTSPPLQSDTVFTVAINANEDFGSVTLSQTVPVGVTGANLTAATVSVTERFAANGAVVSMLGNPVSIGAGTFIAQTDGFVVGTVAGPASVDTCGGWVFASVPGYGFVAATGGSLVTGTGRVTCSITNSNSFTVPVAAGTSFSTVTLSPSGTCQQAEPDLNIYWVPLGSGAIVPAVTRTGDAPPELLDLARMRSQESGDRDDGLVDALAAALRNLPSGDRARLIDALGRV